MEKEQKNLGHLTDEEKEELKKLKKSCKKYRVKNLCFYSIATIYFTILMGYSVKEADTRYMPFFNESVTYYSNDELTYSSLDAYISRIEKEDCYFGNLTTLESSERLKFYSNWEKIGNIWCRTVSNTNITEEDIITLETLVKENASLEKWEDILSYINLSGDYVVETLEEEPIQKQGYFEFKMIDDTSYEVEPTSSKKIKDTIVLGSIILIFPGIFEVGNLAITYENQNKRKKRMKELIKK